MSLKIIYENELGISSIGEVLNIFGEGAAQLVTAKFSDGVIRCLSSVTGKFSFVN